jgi:hypothetical protein
VFRAARPGGFEAVSGFREHACWLTQRALDAGESARFQAVSSPQPFSPWTASPSLRPSASNASRWALMPEP